MMTVNDFIKDNNLKVEVSIAGSTYICKINGEEGDFTFTMTRDKLLEHMRRFCHKDAVEKMIADERFVRTHFRRLAVTWWHIQVVGAKLSKELDIK